MNHASVKCYSVLMSLYLQPLLYCLCFLYSVLKKKPKGAIRVSDKLL